MFKTANDLNLLVVTLHRRGDEVLFCSDIFHPYQRKGAGGASDSR
ncbi:hypothetical protein [Cognataquiflexum nitidum]|nr:hypothetical protein [Cognataquiflexum nitidum]